MLAKTQDAQRRSRPIAAANAPSFFAKLKRSSLPFKTTLLDRLTCFTNLLHLEDASYYLDEHDDILSLYIDVSSLDLVGLAAANDSGKAIQRSINTKELEPPCLAIPEKVGETFFIRIDIDRHISPQLN